MNNKKIIGITGYSGCGKTTLLKKIIQLMVLRNIKVGSLKHAHHDIELDIPGKDSYELRKSGALQTIVACDKRYALIEETPDTPADLKTLINRFTDVDVILIEGFKDEQIPKIMCHLKQCQKPLFIDDFTIAVASDEPLITSLPLLDINQPEQIVNFINNYLFCR